MSNLESQAKQAALQERATVRAWIVAHPFRILTYAAAAAMVVAGIALLAG